MAELPVLSHPRKTYSFTDFSKYAPNTPIPGDRLDTELNELRARLTAVVDVLQGMLNGEIGLPEGPTTLSLPGVVGSRIVDLATGHVSGGQRRLPVLQPIIDVTPAARQALDTAHATADRSKEQADRAAGFAGELRGMHARAIEAASLAEDQARDVFHKADTVRADRLAAEAAKDQVESLISAEELAAIDAIAAQQLAWKWAEYLSGPVMTEAEYDALDPSLIPPGYVYNPVTGMGTAGLWSSKWWAVTAQQTVSGVQDSLDAANAAAQAAQDAQAAAEAAQSEAEQAQSEIGDFYLGAHATAPTVDLDGSPLEVGDLYYNTVALSMRTWSGTSWDPFSGSTTVLASDIVSLANPGQGIAATNVQAALDEIATERATVTALATETTNRTNADNTLQTNINTETTARQNADAALQSDINSKASSAALAAETSARIADVDAEESARIAADNTLTANLATETTNRTNADTTLTNNLNTEITQRQAADSAETTARQTADTNEANARIAADALKVDKTANDGAAVLPAGTTGQRPGSPAAGYVRYNSTTGKFEGFATAWGTLGGGAAISDTPPTNPSHGDLWWESDTGNTYIRYDDGNSAQWVQTNYSPENNLHVAKAGDTMTGNLLLTSPNASIGAGVTPPANLTMSHSFSQAMSSTLYWFNAYQTAGPTTNRALAAGYAAYISHDIAAGGLAIATSAVSLAAGAQFTPIARAVFYPTNYIHIGPRLVATDAMGNGSYPSLTVYSQAFGAAFGWYMPAAAQLACIGMTYDGQTSGSALLNISRASGLSSVGPDATMGFTDNGSGSRVLLFQNNTFFYSQTSTGNMFWNIAGSQAMQLTTTGLAVTGSLGQKSVAGSWTAPSDERIKDVLGDYDAGLAEIIQLRPIRYTFKAECHQDDDEHVGLVAQEAEIAMPDLITSGPGEMGEIVLDDMRKLDPSNVMWALVNSVKELNTRLEALEAA